MCAHSTPLCTLCFVLPIVGEEICSLDARQLRKPLFFAGYVCAFVSSCVCTQMCVYVCDPELDLSPPKSKTWTSPSETFNPRTKSQKSTSLASTMRIGLQVSHKFISADLHVQREVFFFSMSSGFSNTNDKKHDQRGSGSTLGSLKLPSRDMEHSLPCRQCRALTAARHRIPA